ncbi:MAG: hypothetical protein R8G01_05815 [Ilumatobacteraceae bacterium]|nr:hypothetical protein [Ilumatobacteraceae bacterium]
MAEIDDLVRRTVDTVKMIADKATAFATRLLLGAAVVCIGGFLLGVAALSGGIEQVWIVLGLVFGAIAIGSALIARWRVGSVRRHVPELANEVRTLISEGRHGTRTVIDTFVVDADGEGDGERDGFDRGSAIMMSRQMYGFKSVVGSGLDSSARLTAAVTALTSFPGLVFGAIAISLVFGFLGAIFLIALAL